MAWMRARFPRSVAAFAFLAWFGCSSGESLESPGPPPNPPNVLLITIDTLRADRLASYGYTRRTSPYLDALADSGVRFERAYATSSWTAPSVASLLTSLDPIAHGIEHGHLRKQVIVRQEVIPDSLETLPERLRAAGYRTFGVTANTHLYGRFGFDQGFDRYECVGFQDAAAVISAVAAWREEITTGDRPWFLWVHLLDPHAPYRPQPPWIKDFHPHYLRLWHPVRGVIVPEDYRDFGAAKGTPLYDLANALYDSEIAATDRAIRRLVSSLDASANDLIVVTADHGEEFLDHDRFGHGRTLFDEVIRVPLILRLPGAAHAGESVATPVSLVDVLPTVLDVVGADAPVDVQGRSLLPLVAGREIGARDVTASLDRFRKLGKDSLVRGKWKYIEPRVGTDGPMLFDLERDPAETDNRIDAEPELARVLAEALAASLAASRARKIEPGSVDLSDEEFEQLKALGYVPH